MKVLELFSGTHSIGEVLKEKGWEVVSLDRDLGAESPFSDYVSDKHIKCDINTWDYKKDYKPGDFDLITASPVCLWWSNLRYSWIGRKCKSIHPTDVITKEILDADIDRYGKPMVDKVFEMIEYFKPKNWWIENPQTGRMRKYIAEKYPTYDTYYDVDYCKYSNWGYKKRTRFWTNIEGFTPKKCKLDCENIIIQKEPKKKDRKLHKKNICCSKTIMDGKKLVRVNTAELREKYKDHKNIDSMKTTKLERYRIPVKIVEDLAEQIKPKKERKIHKCSFGSKDPNQKCIGGGQSRLERYRIPKKLVNDFTEHI
jgi:hypothetical protein